MNKEYESLYKFTEEQAVISTHSHHLKNSDFENFSLKSVFSCCYLTWLYQCDYDSYDSRKKMMEDMGTNTYFIWLAKSLGKLYNNGEPLNADNWDKIDGKLKEAYNADPKRHLNILTDICKYESIIIDKYEAPGSDNGVKGLFRPAFRCDSFLCAYIEGVTDENKTNPYEYSDRKPKNLTEYIEMMEKTIAAKKKSGCCALKIAIAYERGLDFKKCSLEEAEEAFGNKNATEKQKKRFADYVMYELCRISAKHKMPLQIHTGMGIIKKSNAINLRNLIADNPLTTFVIFHCSYPWMDDALALGATFRNVILDMCWLPSLSTSAAIRFLAEALEAVDAARITWGCDTWNSEESFGALLAMRHTLASVLSEKVTADDISMDYAQFVAQNILYSNAKRIYGL